MRGRTARQDNPGQYYVVLSKSHEPFASDRNYINTFLGLSDMDRIYHPTQGMLQKKDFEIKGVLMEYSSSQAKGAWLNELCEKYYSTRPRDITKSSWPSKEHYGDDRKLCDLLSRGYINGQHLKSVVSHTFADIVLEGPPLEV